MRDEVLGNVAKCQETRNLQFSRPGRPKLGLNRDKRSYRALSSLCNLHPTDFQDVHRRDPSDTMQQTEPSVWVLSYTA
jgi:hypothetical protein